MKKLYKFIVFFFFLGFTCESNISHAATHYFSTVRNLSGDSVSGATVTVYLAGTNTLASVFSNQLGTVSKSNPFLSDSNGNYDFYVESGLYKVVVSKVGVGTYTNDNISIGVTDHAASHENGGSDEVSLSNLSGTITSSKISDGTILNTDISPSAAIAESKLSLNFSTHSNTNDPTTDQKAALGGTSGLPSVTNKYVTNNDSRNSNARTPTTHAASHTDGGSDEIIVTTGQLSGVNAGTNLINDLEEEAHASEHQDGGTDEISVTGLSGTLADAQKSEVMLNGVSVGTRPKINLMEGTDIDLTVVDNVGQNRVDVTVNSTASTSATAPIEVYDGITPIVTETSRLTFDSTQFVISDTGSNRVNILIDSMQGDLEGPIVSNGIKRFNGYDISQNSPEDHDGFVYFLHPDARYELSYVPSFAHGTSISDGQVPMYENNVTDVWLPKWPMSSCVNSVDCETGPSINFSSLFTISNTSDGDPIEIGLDEETLRDSQKIRGKEVTTDAVSDGQTMIFDSVLDKWVYGAGTSDLSLSYIIPLISQDDFFNINTIRFIDPLVVGNPSAGVAVISLGPITNFDVHSIRDNHIYWGSDVGQVDADDIPNGSSQSFIPNAQLSELTSTNNTGLHYHASDRALANATGTLPANQVGNGLTNTQVLDNITISAAGNVDAGALTSGTVPTLRLGNQKYQTKSIVIPYPNSYINIPFGNIYMPVVSTITQVAGRIRETVSDGNCTVQVKIDSTSVLTSPLASDANGEITNTILNPTISAGTWMSFLITGCTSADDANELSITVVYSVN